MVLNPRSLVRASANNKNPLGSGISPNTFVENESSPVTSRKVQKPAVSTQKPDQKPAAAAVEQEPRVVPNGKVLQHSTSSSEHVNPSWGRFNGNTWGTVIGCGAICVFCPQLVILVWVALNSFKGSISDTLVTLFNIGPLEFVSRYSPAYRLESIGLYAAWLFFQMALYAWLPSQTCYGQRTPAGHLLPYKVNGLLAWVVTHTLAVGAVVAGVMDPAIIAKHWEGLLWASNIYGFLLPAVAYIKAHVAPTHLDDRKFSGSIVYDYYMGIELNPRFGEWWDFKLFHNGRPGIVAWTLIDLSFAAWQYQLHGYISNSMVIVNILHAFYVVDFFVNEDWYLRTIDICHDHYGFYLAWGSMVWLPTIYTLQTQYLARYPVDLHPVVAGLILTTGISGYILFRSVNHQKDIVRRTGGECNIWGSKAKVVRAKYRTEDGVEHESLLLCSGWWGLTRHANYLGDLILSYSMCAACGFGGGIIPWTYAIFMTILLIQRCIRDDERCTGKYGKYWKQYCEKVRWRLIPGIY